LLGSVTAIVMASASASVPSPASAFSSELSLPPTGAGVDISFPQCVSGSHVDLPASIPFAVVGVNGGVASDSNPCFQSEYNSAILLAGSTEQPHATVYVNTGNPSLKAAWWPADDTTQAGTTVTNPDGSCTYTAAPACAYIYGYSMAQADYRRVHKQLEIMPKLWWLDVETTNTWQTDVTANAASLTGMVDYFHGRGLDVGLYSTSYQWKKIAGVTLPSSNLAGLRSWLAGGSQIGAPVDCEKNSLTPNGWVAMVQYVAELDNDYSCRLFGAASAAISPATPSVAGNPLTAVAADWTSGSVSYSYQWDRDGTPIPGATGNSYATTSADIGTNITVTVTGMKIGYSTMSKTSGAVAILALTA
jgi:hypothetical protein